MKIELNLTEEEVQYLLSFANAINNDDIVNTLKAIDYDLHYVEGGINKKLAEETIDIVFWKIYDQLRPLPMFDKYNDVWPISHINVGLREVTDYKGCRL